MCAARLKCQLPMRAVCEMDKVSPAGVREQFSVAATPRRGGLSSQCLGVAMMSVLKTSFCGGNGVSEGSEGLSTGCCSSAVGPLPCTAWEGDMCLPQTCHACVLNNKLQTGPSGGAETCVMGVRIWDLSRAIWGEKGDLC